MNRPLTSAATLLLLATSTFGFQTATEPQTPVLQGSPAAQPTTLPKTFTHPLGFSLRHPADWRIMQSSGTTALLPPSAPDLDKNPTEFYALTALPEPANIEEHLKADIAQSLPGLQLQSATTDRGTTTLRYRTAESPTRISAVIRGTTRDNLLIVMAALGLEPAITKHDAIAAEIFTTITAAPRSLDPAIRGRWTNSSSYSSTNFSMATSRTCTLNADGTYTYSSQTAGGTADVSADSGATRTSGLWTAKDGTLTLTPEGGTPLTYKYRLVDNNLVTTQGNKRTIWSRN